MTSPDGTTSFVEFTASLFHALQILGRPEPHSAKSRSQTCTQVGQFIVDSWRHHGMHGPRDQAITLHVTQGLRQHFLADPFDRLADLCEAQLASLGQHLQNQHGPFVGHAADELINQGLNAGIDCFGRASDGVRWGYFVAGSRCPDCHVFTHFLVCIVLCGAYFHWESVQCYIGERKRGPSKILVPATQE